MRYEPGDKVEWYGSTGTVVGVFEEPCVVIEWANGTRTTVGVSVLERPRIS